MVNCIGPLTFKGDDGTDKNWYQLTLLDDAGREFKLSLDGETAEALIKDKKAWENKKVIVTGRLTRWQGKLNIKGIDVKVNPE